MKNLEKLKALELRKSGESLKDISRRLNVAKSSVSTWVRNVYLTKKQKENLCLKGNGRDIVEKRRTTRIFNEKNKREVVMLKAEKGINDLNKHDLKIIGTMLYWAEGRKRGARVVSFSNSDQNVIRIIMRYFREICFVPESKFRAQIHTHSHLNIIKSKKYWSDIIGISQNQFYKTYCKPSSSSKGKMDSLPYGTLDIYVCDTILFLKIMGWIRGITNKLI